MKKESLTFQVITLEDIENHKTDIEDIEICLLTSTYPLVKSTARFYNKEVAVEAALNKYMKETVTVELMQSLYKERVLKYKERKGVKNE